MNLSETYTRLANVPLFTGLSGEDLYMICEKVNLRWVKLHKEQVLIQQDEPSSHLTILLEGELTRTTSHKKNMWTVKDVVCGPLVIEPEQLYGLKCRFRHRYEARTDCKILFIRKDEMRRVLLNLPLWRTNLLNLMASNMAKQTDWNEATIRTLSEKIKRFGLDYLSAKYAPHSLNIRQVDLGAFLGESRRTISMELHKMIDNDEVEIRPNLIIFKPSPTLSHIVSSEQEIK